MKNIKVISADIDGTITASDRTTSKANIETIKKLRNKGYLFGLASGRPIEDIVNKYEEWGLEKQFDFLIGWNGGQLYDDKTKKTYTYNYMSPSEIKETIDFMSDYDCTINMYFDGIYLSSKDTDKAWFSAFKSKRKFIMANSIEEFYKQPNGGIMFRTKSELMPIIEKRIEEELKNRNYIGFKTQADLMEFSHKDCNKGYALKKYLDMYNISTQDCAAFGDTTNDNEMLKICYGICLKNGSEDTKRCAKIITDIDCDHDGFTDFVEKHIL